MRVASNIRVLDGALRAAVYDLERGLCWPASREEVSALENLSRKKSANISTKTMVDMRQKGWIVAGSPALHDLSIMRPERRPPGVLDHVWVEVTNACNLQCKHCYAGSSPTADRTTEMDEEGWLNVIDDIVNYGVRKITFIGGEPTLRLELVDRIATHVRDQKYNVLLRMFSNLSVRRLRSETIDLVARHNIEFGTALYGKDPKTHDNMTGKGGSFAATMESIRLCVETNVDVYVGMYLDFNATDSITEHEYWLKSLGVKRFQVLAPSRVGRGISKDWKTETKFNSIPGTMVFSDHQWETGRSGHNCFHDHMAIQPDGNVSPCIMTRNNSYGNISSSGIRGILQSAEYERFGSMSKDQIPGCKDCEFRYACFDCRPDAMQGAKDFLRKPNCGYDPTKELGDILA